MGFSRQEYWGGLPFPPPGDLPNPGIKLESPASLPLAGRFSTIEPPGKPLDSAGTPSMLALLPSPLTWTLKGSGLTAPEFSASTFSSKIL